MMMVKIPRTFKLLDVPLPPMLLELVGVGQEHRFVFLYNWYGKPTWSDGNSCTTFYFYTVWQPYIQHSAVVHQIHGCNFGTPEEEPSHALVCDRIEEKVYVAPFDAAIIFANKQHPKTHPIAVKHWQALKNQALAYTPVSFEQMQAIGMLEMFMPPTPEHKQQAIGLVRWLDGYVN